MFVTVDLFLRVRPAAVLHGHRAQGLPRGGAPHWHEVVPDGDRRVPRPRSAHGEQEDWRLSSHIGE